MKTFEDYLKNIHAQEYHGVDDDMPDAYDAWVGGLDVGEVMEYAEDWGRLLQGLEPEETFKEKYERIRNK